MDKAKYQLVDEVHNVWQCKACGHLARFEADGPFEDGWTLCPHCGRRLEEERDVVL